MKRIFLFLTLYGLLAATPSCLLAQIIYVKANAPGVSNGTSWPNAFTTLSAALMVATPGDQIWVAAGTYKPTVDPAAHTSFAILAGTELYGGFAGTETNLSERNYLTNVTTLSGDINGDDVPTDLTINRVDNAWHVLTISNGSPASRAVVDGFVIRNGHTKTATGDPDPTRRGGGISANAKLTVRNCLFTENQGFFGAGLVAIGAIASSLIVDHCIFDNNLSTNASAGIYLQNSTGASITRCTFRDNNTNRGTLYPSQCKNLVIDSCRFENNMAGVEQWGAGLYNWQSSYTITNSVFTGNVALNAAAMYNDGREGGDFFSVDSCTFEQNSTTGYGGSGMFNFNASYDIRHCSFLQNTAPTSAAGIYLGGETAPDGHIQDCLFNNGSTIFGGGIANYSSPGLVTIAGCTFSNNMASTSGGAMTNGFLANTAVKNCIFEANTAGFGGAIFVQNDSTALSIDSSFFDGNSSSNIGGAIYLSAGNTSRITNSTFQLNSSNNGAALSISEDSLDLSTSIIDRCLFQENFALVQAGAVNIENADVTMTNTLFAGNQVLGEGAGGAVLLNGFGSKTARLTAVNCTWGGNFGPLGSGLAQFEGDSGQAEVTLQNCIFSNQGDNYAVEAGDPTVTSLGGNLSSDATLADFLIANNDLNDTDPMFVEPGFYDFHLLPGSPAIDQGLADGAPGVDLDGHPRVGPPDAGSYEWGTTGTRTPSFALPLTLQPNPAVDVVRTTIENDWRGDVLLDVVDASGRVVRHLLFTKTGEKMPLEFSVAELPQGPYAVQLQMGTLRMSGGLVKS